MTQSCGLCDTESTFFFKAVCRFRKVTLISRSVTWSQAFDLAKRTPIRNEDKQIRGCMHVSSPSDRMTDFFRVAQLTSRYVSAYSSYSAWKFAS